MSERHSQSGLNAVQRTVRRTAGMAPPQARGVRDEAEAQRLYRRGVRAESRGHAIQIWQEPARNGLPFRPYVYRGRGYDIYETEDVAS
jgi:hypothetical protein